MAVQFAQPYRFSEQQLARMAQACLVPRRGIALISGVPYQAGAPVRFSSEDYHRLGEIGVIGDDERVELIDGEVIQMTPMGGQHQTVVFDIDDYLDSVVGPGLRVAAQAAVKLDGAEPVPDLVVLRRAAEIRGKLPRPAACVLAVEVADSSALYDRSGKRELYARGEIAEYWVVDLSTRTVVLHLRPLAGDYQDVSEHPRGASFVSPGLGTEVHVDDLLR
ncbi:Uma2 family endonuclease [Longimicrobium sp.]|uniref:Uma2 family endonuclease n=1 Tax=Longimicrobium sp. TaxID=2029185 RepID=UPI002E37BD82|nr:Uma2 family endonuclease [Longimicrobium sp.]HEX6042410.1 Uma2 family endonuclease [Longimicrobium sp.]